MGDFGPPAPPPVDGDSSPSSISEEDVTVLVTGFGPFRNNPLNPSYLIASSLPPSIPFPAPSRAKPPADDQTPSPASASRKIHIHTHPSPLRVSYPTVRDAVPAILDSFAQNHDGKRPDIIVHIGLASARRFYAVETLAHRDGYCMPDVDGRLGFEDGEKRWREQSLPEVLRPGPAIPTKPNGNNNDKSLRTHPTTVETREGRTTMETRAGDPSSYSSTGSSSLASPTAAAAAEASITTTTFQPINPFPPDLTFLQNWKSFSPSSADVRLSHDAGRYLCEFIYYTSLAQAWREGQPLNAVFLHVPGPTDDESLEKGKEVAIGLVKTLVSCWVDGV